MRRLLGVAAAALAVAGAALPATAAADAGPAQRDRGRSGAWAGDPARQAERIRDGLFRAQADLILAPATADRAARAARRRYAGSLAAGVRRADPRADAAVRRALDAAVAAAAARDPVRLASVRGAAGAALLRGSFAVTLAAAGRGDAAQARAWLLLREFRTATRFTRPGADATLAVQRLARGRLAPARARAAVAKDLLDAYQSRLRELLDDAARGAERELPVRRAEAAARAEGLFAILAARYAEDRGKAAAGEATAAYAELRRAALGDDLPAFAAARDRAARALEGFTAAPFTEREAARRAQQLLRFVALVPVEYGRGVDDDRVTLDFEIQEAVAFRTGAAGAFGDLRDQLAKRDRARTEAAAGALDRLGRLVGVAADRRDGVPAEGDVEREARAVEDAVTAAMPESWKEGTDESDYDLIALTLDRMEAAAGAGQQRQAEQARLEAYAFFEFGPERRLKAFDPALALDVEGLMWFDGRGRPGLARLIADRAPRREIRETRRELDAALEDAAATLGDATSRATVVTNSAILVFREGLEAVLILAAITASFIGARQGMRRPVLVGALLGLGASVLTWLVAETLVSSLTTSGEKLEAVTGIIAIAVLLLVTNWFFHRVYWSEWIGRFHRRRRALERIDAVGFLSAQTVGLCLLGLTSVYREGFETVLFLQSLQVSAGTVTVVEGAVLGLVMTFAVGAVTFLLQRKLPYKRMLVVTGVMIGFVLIVMVGGTARTMQGVGWLPITPLGGEPPAWLGVWFGVYPTVETMLAQAVAAAFVIGSYFVAQEMKVKGPRRRARRERQAAPAAQPAGPEAPNAQPAAPAPHGHAPPQPAAEPVGGSR